MLKHKTEEKLHKEIIKVITDLTEVNWRSYWSLFTTKYFHAQAVSIYFYNYSTVLREQYEISQKVIGYTIAFQSCVGTISSFLTGWINKTFYKNDITHSKKYFYGFIIMTVAFALLCTTNNMYSFLICLIPLAISNSFLRIVETEILLAKSENERGSLVGTSNSLSSLARLAAPLCSGLLGDILGQGSVMYLSVILSFFGMIVAGFISTKRKQHIN